MKTNELLRRYVDDRSEPAFEELVKRHIGLVYSSALRQLNGDVHAAQDVTQAVFTELARSAPRLIRHPSLEGWLYTCARNLAAKAFHTERRRRSHEQEAHEMNERLHTTNFDTAWQELRPVLDDAMHDLRSADRDAILMRYFERLPLAEVGARLGLKENAAHMRIDRAMGRLRAALAKHGVTSTIAALSVVLTGRAVGGAPAGLAAKVSRAAFASAAATGGLGWGLLKLAGLMQGKLLVAAGATVLVAVLFILPQVLSAYKEAASSTPDSTATRKQAAATGAPASLADGGANGSDAANQSMASNKLVLHVVANDTGKPIAGATIAFWFRTNGAAIAARIFTNITDALGVCEIPIVRGTVGLLGVGSRTEGYADTAFVWRPEQGETIPRQYTLALEKATPIGGQVVDEDGKPVPGVAVTVWPNGNPTPEDHPNPPHIYIQAQETVITDAEGRWSIDRVSRKAISTLNFQAVHPDYVKKMGSVLMNDPQNEQPLLAGAYVYKLDHGTPVSGIVVDAEGQPVSGAKVEVTSGSVGSELSLTTTTNQLDGTFTLPHCKIGPARISAEAHGFVMAAANVEITTNQTPVRLELRRGNLLRLRVVNAKGKPVTNAIVSLARVDGPSGGIFRERTDTNGQITWDAAPGGDLVFAISAQGYSPVRNFQANADGDEHLVTLHPAPMISGSVRDVTTGQAVSTFRVVSGEVGSPWSENDTNVYWIMSKTYYDGAFSLSQVDRAFQDRSSPSKKYKIEADGYAPFITRVVKPNEGEVSFDILLYPAAATTISVLLPDGQPATNASIGLDMPGTTLNLTPGGLSPAQGDYSKVLSVDDAGQFALPPDDTITRVIAASPDGYAEASPAALAAKSTMRLQPWGRLEGTLLSGGKPAAGQELTLEPRYGPIYRFFNVETDAHGHFVFPKAPPGEFNLDRIDTEGIARYFRPVQIPKVTLRLGETTTVSPVLYTVTARLRLPAGAPMATNWKTNAAVSQDQFSEPLKSSGDGTWMAEDIPAGDYTLDASVVDSAADRNSQKTYMKAKMSFTLPGDAPTGTLDLGEIRLQPVQE